jgi:hypothetical protein
MVHVSKVLHYALTTDLKKIRGFGYRLTLSFLDRY